MTPQAYTSRFVSAHDGLRLHVRDYHRRTEGGTPVVCLAGLARTGADFDALAGALAGGADAPRRVLALDSRGRGGSEYDRDPANYSLAIELADLIAVSTALEVGRAVVIGTSRGGILAMMLATVRPAAIAGVVLNDIGPVIEPKGLVRIKSYVGKLPQPKSFEEAADLLRRLFDSQFTKLTSDEWLAFARRTFKQQDGRIIPDYDPHLSKSLAGFDLERPLPTLWKEFDALARVPVMVIRGANSDILSPATVNAMRERRTALDIIEVPDQGHAPHLRESDVIARICAFVSAAGVAARIH